MSRLAGDELNIDGRCFACGPDNPHGLHMRVVYQGERAVCRINLPAHFQGWADIAHGGVVLTLMDEIMAYAVIHFLGQGVTIGMESRFRKQVPLGQDLVVSGWVVEHKSRQAKAAAELRLAADESLLAEANARWLLKLGPDGQPVSAGI
ncbi:MAG: PaaI family thioesterase [Pseudomonadota bacterium]